MYSTIVAVVSCSITLWILVGGGAEFPTGGRPPGPSPLAPALQITRKLYRQSYSYNGGLTESHTWSIDPPFSITLNDPKQRFQKSGHCLTLNISEMAKDTVIVTMEGE